MFPHLPRILYILAAIAWLLMLRPYPITLFMAGCMACLTLPLYLFLQKKCPSVTAVLLYALSLCAMVVVPISVLILLVIPQVSAGVAMFNQLRAANFQLPPHWIDFFHSLRESVAAYPWLNKIIMDAVTNAESMIGQAVSTVVSSSFGVLGGTITALWLLVLFITVTTLCAVYARQIHDITASILGIPVDMLNRFISAVRKALRGVMLGVILVALAQGVLCGLGFAVAGVKEPAFWGLLATLVAPIPVLGTALVWMPLCLVLWFSGNGMAAVGLALWGTIAVAGIDNVLRPLFLRSGIRAPLFVLIVSILCGMASMGPAGIIAGPVLLAFSMQAVKEGDKLQSHV